MDKNTHKIFEISTMHITPAADEWLQNHESEDGGLKSQTDFTIYRLPYGWLVCTEAEGDGKDTPPELMECINRARDAEARWLLLDADAEVCADLPDLTDSWESEAQE